MSYKRQDVANGAQAIGSPLLYSTMPYGGFGGFGNMWSAPPALEPTNKSQMYKNDNAYLDDPAPDMFDTDDDPLTPTTKDSFDQAGHGRGSSNSDTDAFGRRLSDELTSPRSPMSPNTASSRGKSRYSTKDWVRLVGLPFGATEASVAEFFHGYGLLTPDSIYLVVSSGKPTGRAFVQLNSEEESARAARELNKRYIGRRYIDVRQVVHRDVLRELRIVACGQESLAPGSPAPVGVDVTYGFPVAFLPISRTGNCVKLVGLPFTCSSDHVLQFLQGLRVRAGGVHFMTRQGKATGKCVVEMEDAVEALRAVKQAHHKWMQQRYIEVYLARPCDLFCDPDELKNTLIVTIPADELMERLAKLVNSLPVEPTNMVILPSESARYMDAYLPFTDEEGTNRAMDAAIKDMGWPAASARICTQQEYHVAQRASGQAAEPEPEPAAPETTEELNQESLAQLQVALASAYGLNQVSQVPVSPLSPFAPAAAMAAPSLGQMDPATLAALLTQMQNLTTTAAANGLGLRFDDLNQAASCDSSMSTTPPPTTLGI